MGRHRLGRRVVAARVIRLPNAWDPRDYQLNSWIAWRAGIKRELLVWHRRAGKDDVQMHKIAVAAHPSVAQPNTNARIANYWHCLPQFDQARRAIWEAVNPHTGKRRIDEAFPPALRKSTRNDNMTIEFHSGSTYRIVGSDNPDSLVGAAPFGIVFSEWALSNPSVWPYLAPILNENGGWASFVTTPRGRNHVHSMLQEHRRDPKWFCETLTVDDTGVISRAQIEEDRKTYRAMFGIDAADSLIEQEYWCSFEAAILGAYYGRELVEAERAGRITMVAPVQGFPVHTAWDLGVRDGNAIIWWQAVPGRDGIGKLAVIDYEETTGKGIPYFAALIKKRARDRLYERGNDYLPHDGRQREMGSFAILPDDGAEIPADFGNAKQRIEVMLECGLKPKIVRDHKVQDGISAFRQLLPRMWIDETHCADMLEAWRQYQTEWDEDKRVFKDKPLHNWASHGADAGRTMAMAYQEINIDAKPERPRGLQVAVDGALQGSTMGQVTLDDLWGARASGQRRI